MQTLLEKAKTLQEWMDEVVYERMGKLLVPQNPKQVAEQLVRLEDAQQEIDKLKHFEDLYIKNIQRLERERGEWKQKLYDFFEWLQKTEWRGVSSELYEEFKERFKELLKK